MLPGPLATAPDAPRAFPTKTRLSLAVQLPEETAEAYAVEGRFGPCFYIQGRVAVLHNMLRDSNGDLRIALNSTALGPGSYRLAILVDGEPQ